MGTLLVSKVREEYLYPPWELFFTFVHIKRKRRLNILFLLRF